jgi:hypothetical protein
MSWKIEPLTNAENVTKTDSPINLACFRGSRRRGPSIATVPRTRPQIIANDRFFVCEAQRSKSQKPPRTNFTALFRSCSAHCPIRKPAPGPKDAAVNTLPPGVVNIFRCTDKAGEPWFNGENEMEMVMYAESAIHSDHIFSLLTTNQECADVPMC